MSPRLRADRLLVERGLFESRAKAQAAIAAGGVLADGAPVRRSSDEIARDAALSAAPAHPFVSRGGVKLAAALDACAIDVTGGVCLDVGASTGGFTHVLLDRGARLVYAVDVGRDQLHPRLRDDPRVILIEATNIRALDRGRLAEPPSLIVIDVSFISLKLVLPAALALAAPDCRLVALIKPQFEAGRARINKGVVRDPAIHATVCDDIAARIRALGCAIEATLPSPIEGGDGNREFLLVARRGAA
jgi:23S rRNA (cytidine1920-2'-O)/16S rRNA (cytidine1409-2'-O)-methyltransferase